MGYWRNGSAWLSYASGVQAKVEGCEYLHFHLEVWLLIVIQRVPCTSDAFYPFET